MKIGLLILIFTLFIGCGESGTYSENYNIGECEFNDGTYNATVEYYNPDTDYSANYFLEVEVYDCEVVKINFPKGGWLDIDHLSAGQLDQDGHTVCEDEDGKTYDIQMDN